MKSVFVGNSLMPMNEKGKWFLTFEMTVFLNRGQHLSLGGLVEESSPVGWLLISGMRRVTVSFCSAGVSGQFSHFPQPTADWDSGEEVTPLPGLCPSSLVCPLLVLMAGLGHQHVGRTPLCLLVKCPHTARLEPFSVRTGGPGTQSTIRAPCASSPSLCFPCVWHPPTRSQNSSRTLASIWTKAFFLISFLISPTMTP